MAAFTGARKGEIRGFLWQGYDGYAIEVKQSVWRNQVGEPKREKSKGTIPVIAQLELFLDRHRASSGNPSQGFIFRNLWGNPLNLDALVTEMIQPTLEAEKIFLGTAGARFGAGWLRIFTGSAFQTKSSNKFCVTRM